MDRKERKAHKDDQEAGYLDFKRLPRKQFFWHPLRQKPCKEPCQAQHEEGLHITDDGDERDRCKVVRQSPKILRQEKGTNDNAVDNRKSDV